MGKFLGENDVWSFKIVWSEFWIFMIRGCQNCELFHKFKIVPGEKNTRIASHMLEKNSFGLCGCQQF